MKALVSFSYKHLLQKRGHSLFVIHGYRSLNYSYFIGRIYTRQVELPRTHLGRVASGIACKNRRHFGDQQTSTWSIGDYSSLFI